jgi:hypothetical protein
MVSTIVTVVNLSLAKHISSDVGFEQLRTIYYMVYRVKSDFLFAQPSFASGFARTLDLFGQFDRYNSSSTPAEADTKALAADWFVVGQDIVDAIEQEESQDSAA